ncbi:hypothetical protein HY251_15920 [bacterium]|nr:hypothetical protein [bacterium]
MGYGSDDELNIPCYRCGKNIPTRDDGKSCGECGEPYCTSCFQGNRPNYTDAVDRCAVCEERSG